MPSSIISGLHHVTAICGDAQRNVDFYTGTLGLWLVKLTVKDDDASAYHLYYGDAKARVPATLISFIIARPRGPQALGGRNVHGGFISAIPVGTTDFWRARLDGFRCETFP